MSTFENTIWTEKYRPNTLQEYVGNRQIVKEIKNWITTYKTLDNTVKPFLILHGCPGVGKTTLAHIIFKEFGFDTIEYNASDTRTKKTISETIGTIGKFSISILQEGNVKCQVGLIMDEIDGLTGGINGGVEELINIVMNKNTPIIKTSKSSRGNKNASTTIKTKSSPKFSNEDQNDIITTTTKSTNKILTLQTNSKPYKFPVICTCNSIKDKKLAILLKEAVVIKILQPKVKDFINLGLKISKLEKLDLNENMINTIISYSKKDYRCFIFNLFQYSLSRNLNFLNIDTSIENITNDDDTVSTHLTIKNSENNDNISENVLGKIGYLINNNVYTISDILRFIEADSNVYFLGIYANWLTILKDFNHFNQNSTNPTYLINRIFNCITNADKIHQTLFRTQYWDMETYKNIIGSVEILTIFRILKNKNNKMNTHLFNLSHHSKFNQMALEEANMRRKIISLSTISGLTGSSINNIQSMYYAFNVINPSLIQKENIMFKEYKEMEKVFKTITTKMSLF